MNLIAEMQTSHSVYAQQHEEELSLLALGATLLRRRWRIVRWAFAGAVVAGVLVSFKPTLYQASASFISQGGADAGRSGLAGLAGQLGVTLPLSGQAVSPDFYTKLLKSRMLLLPIVRGSFALPELGPRRVAFLDLFKIRGQSAAEREDRGVDALTKLVSVSIDKNTGIIGYSIETRWRSVSLAIVQALLDGVNDYNQRTRQGQAGAERKFLEGRLAVASSALRDAEDNLERFQRTNRDLGGSPTLSMARDRLERDLAFRQQVYTSLTQSYEDARAREVRDTPVITVFEPPSVPAFPQPRGRSIGILLGLIGGGLLGVIMVVISEMVARYDAGNDVNARAFSDAVANAKGDWRWLAFWRR